MRSPAAPESSRRCRAVAKTDPSGSLQSSQQPATSSASACAGSSTPADGRRLVRPGLLAACLLSLGSPVATAGPGSCPDRPVWAVAPGSAATIDGIHANGRSLLFDDGHNYLGGDAIPELPDGVRLAAVDLGPAGEIWFVVESTVTLGGITARPHDVVGRVDGVFHKVFDGAAHDLPAGTRITAMDNRFGMRLVFARSFTHRDMLIRPIDVMRVEGDVLVRDFDGLAAGLPLTARIGALALASPESWRLALTGSGRIAGQALARSRVFAYQTGTNNLTLDYEMSERSLRWSATGLSALAILAHPDHLFCFGFESF